MIVRNPLFMRETKRARPRVANPNYFRFAKPGGDPATEVHVIVPPLMACPLVSASSAQNAGFRLPEHSACGASAKPSLFRAAIPPGVLNRRSTLNRPFPPTSSTTDCPLHVLSHTAHKA